MVIKMGSIPIQSTKMDYNSLVNHIGKKVNCIIKINDSIFIIENGILYNEGNSIYILSNYGQDLLPKNMQITYNCTSYLYLCNRTCFINKDIVSDLELLYDE